MPDGMIIKNVPEGITQERLLQMYQAKPSVTGDVAASVASAIPKGIAGAAGLPGDLVEMLTSAGEFGAAKVGGLFGVPEERFYGMGKPELPMPTSERLRGPVEKATYTPKTEAGRRSGSVVEALSGGVGLGGKAMAVPSLLSGLGAEAAGLLSNDNPWLRALGGFMAPVTGGAYNAYRSTPGNMVKTAIGDLSPQQIAEAKAKMEMARSKGVDLTGPEALPPSGIQQLASDTAASQSGGRVFNEFMAKRPEQVRGSVQTNLMDEIGGAGTPDANMARAREAATKAIKEPENDRTAVSTPFYQQARQDAVPTANVEALIKKLEDSRQFIGAANQSAIDDIIGQLKGTQPNAAALDDTYKTLRTSADAPAIGATSQQRAARHVYGSAADDLDSVLKQNSQNIKYGRETYKQISEDVIDPLTSGPVGRVAGKQGFDPSMPESLNPITAIANEKIARPESIRELYTSLNKQDPKAFPGMARTWLENAFDGAQQTIQAGKNRMSGANFAKAVYGTPQQEANFVETMRGVAIANGKNPDEFAKGAKNLLEVLQLTGKVPGIGSPTGGRIAANQMAGNSTSANVLDMVSTQPLSAWTGKLREWAMRGNYKQLAEVMTSPDSIDKIVQLGKYNPKTQTAQYFAAGALGLVNESGR